MNSYLKKKIISLSAPLLTTLQTHRLFEPFYSGCGHILTFHRVIPTTAKVRIHNHLSLEITPEHFEQTILFFQKRGYVFYSLDQLYESLVRGSFPEKFVVFTFDDGYRDNFTVAYPILKKYSVPFIIYITTNFPDRKAILWWYILEDMLREKEQIRFRWEDRDYSFTCRSLCEKERAFDEIRTLVNQSFSKPNFQEMFRTIFGNFQSNPFVYANSLAMSWEEIREISKDPLATIGAHSVNHFPLKQLDSEELVREIKNSKEGIESQIQQPVNHFSYPFGKATEASLREFEMVKSLGFKTATTTRMGNIFPEHKNHLECLPRISINRATKKPVLQLQTSGMLPCLYHKGKKVISH